MERKLAKYLILISLIFFTSQIFSQSQINLLERAYKEDSDSLMKIFCVQWKKDLPVNYVNEANQDSVISSAIEIFKIFCNQPRSYENSSGENYAKPGYYQKMYDNSFRTLNLSLSPSDFYIQVNERIGFFQWTEDSTWNDYFPENKRRDTLKPPELSYFMNGKELNKMKFKNFLPSSIGDEVKFLDSNYTGIFNYFLLRNFRKEQYTYLDSNTLKRTEEEFEKRFSFLTNYIPIYYTGGKLVITDEDKHQSYSRGEGILIGDYSTINGITFDKTLRFATLSISESMESTTYFLERTDQGWKIMKKRTLYI